MPLSQVKTRSSTLPFRYNLGQFNNRSTQNSRLDDGVVIFFDQKTVLRFNEKYKDFSLVSSVSMVGYYY